MILDFLSQMPTFKRIANDECLRVSKTSQNFNIYEIASDYLVNNRMIFVVLPLLFEAQAYYDALLNLLNEDAVLFYPVDDMALASILVSSKEFSYERINTLTTLLDNKPRIVVTNAIGLVKANLPKKRWLLDTLVFTTGENYDLQKIKEALVERGFIHTNVVSQTGEFSTRGSIIDFYPLNYDNPIRLDFFDDELETIKIFDSETQRSLAKIASVKVFPMTEFFYSEEEKATIIKRLKSEKNNCSNEEYQALCEDINRIEERSELNALTKYISLIDTPYSIIDYAENCKLYIVNEDKIEGLIAQNEKEFNNYYAELKSKILTQYHFNLAYEELMKTHKAICFDSLIDHKDSFDVKEEAIEPLYGNFDLLAKNITKRYKDSYVIVSIKNADKLKRFKEYCLENMLHYKTLNDYAELMYEQINIMSKERLLSLSLPQEGIYILGEQQIFSDSVKVHKIRYKSTFSESSKIAKFDDLSPNDYVVHASYGIGMYEGIKTMELSGKKRDYLTILYANNDRLYIPVEQLHLIKKYSGSDGHKPELTKLGSSSWAKTTKKVKEKVKELSEKLIKLYALREEAKGFKFLPDNEMQKEFEASFAYEETIDQMRAIDAVKKDMESDRPMDRLICGDVGFGKTEVALRAAFKAVVSGKQVCYLAPTTILTRQHYYTFKERMEGFGVRVELLNRFVTTKEKNLILKDLKAGLIDVLVGTHRILSKDVIFKDLGLLIIDEEQRFGVMHKERIKEMKVNVDTMTLTATPIPRTLQMSLVGIKELSTIETPPKNRYPVQTYVTPRHDSLIKEAITRELLRGGQIFYLYNYTEDIALVAAKINKLVPEARVCFAHGKMEKNELEDIIANFIDHKFDVLVSTTIIETGIDIPEANTLIIHDADKLGLSQLYQIRGRVGRSDRIAYAYLMYEPKKLLSTDAQKRLEAIKEFTELGSGFKIAMRDLAIRGAGDILGQEQSGFINSVGIDLYMQILDETLREMRPNGSKVIKTVMGKSQLSDHYVPASYDISNDLKIEIHQKINAIETKEDLENLKNEFTDRFGPVEESLLMYMYEKLFYSLCKKNDVENVDVKPKIINITLSEMRCQHINGEFVYRTAYELSNAFLLSYHDKKITISFKTGTYPNGTWLPLMCDYLAKIA